MKAIVCELCGSNKFTKDGEFFVCDYCRTKYSPEQAKSMLVEGTVKVDRSNEIEGLMALAVDAFRSDSAMSAVAHAQDVIKLEPRNAMAWYIRGMCVSDHPDIGTLQRALEYSPGSPYVDEIRQGVGAQLEVFGDRKADEASWFIDSKRAQRDRPKVRFEGTRDAARRKAEENELVVERLKAYGDTRAAYLTVVRGAVEAWDSSFELLAHPRNLQRIVAFIDTASAVRTYPVLKRVLGSTVVRNQKLELDDMEQAWFEQRRGAALQRLAAFPPPPPPQSNARKKRFGRSS